jgi:hypothetical protein
MIDYLTDRLKERSTWLGGATAISALGGFTIPDEKVQAAFVIATFVLGVLTAGTRDKKRD